MWYLVKVSNDERIELEEGIASVGRNPGSTIKLQSSYSSRQHCHFEVGSAAAAERPKLVDFSSNGTFVNGECYINVDILLSEGDRIGIGCWGSDEDCQTFNLPIFILKKYVSALERVIAIKSEPVLEEINSQDVINIDDSDDEGGDGINLDRYAYDEQPLKENVEPFSLPEQSKSPQLQPLPSHEKDESQLLPKAEPQFLGAPQFLDGPQFLSTNSALQSPSTSKSRTSNDTSLKPTKSNENSSIHSDPPASKTTATDQLETIELQSSSALPQFLTKEPNNKSLPSISNSVPQFLIPTATKPSTPAKPLPQIKVEKNIPTTSSHFCDDDIFEISDEEDDFHSQSFLFDIKQETANLDTEESLTIKPDEQDKTDGKPDKDGDDTNRVPSPMFILLDDDDIDDCQSVSNWAMKLSQSFSSGSTTTTPLKKRSQPAEEGDDYDIKTPAKKSRPSSEDPVPSTSKAAMIRDPLKPKSSHQEDREHKHFVDSHAEEPVPSTSRTAMVRDLFKPKLNYADDREHRDFESPASTRKRPVVIDAPSMPVKRGRSRGVSAHVRVSPRSSSLRPEIIKKFSDIRTKEHSANLEKTLKESWRKKPSLERKEEKQRLQDNYVERKEKLKKIAETQAKERSLRSVADKVVKRPKVKVTQHNRAAAFLAEVEEYDKAKREIASKRIPKLSFSDVNKEKNSSDPIKRTSRSDSNKSSDDNSVTSSVPKQPDKVDGTKKSELPATTSSKSKSKTRKSDENDRRNTSTRSQTENRAKTKTKTTDLKSILKPLGNLTQKKQKHSVKFSDRDETRYYEIDDCNVIIRKVDGKDAPIDLSSFVNQENSENRKRLIKPLVDNSELILKDILAWDPNWFETQQPYVNGRSHTLLPMMQQFNTFESFPKIVVPLFKIEIWHSIEKDYQFREAVPFIAFRMNQLASEESTKAKRFICHCETSMNLIKDHKNIFTANELCIVNAQSKSQKLQVFGFIRSTRTVAISSSRSSLHLAVEIDATSVNKSIFESIHEIRIKPISNIRVEIGAFNAVHHLKYSPLGKCIINPFELIEKDEVDVKDIRYKGYDPLNENQTTILLRSYLKCIDSRHTNNVSLIEGPPGTGKSRMITNLSMQILYGSQVRKLSKKILICSQSNAAIDIIAKKLIEIRKKMVIDKFNMVRFGILEKIHPDVKCVSTQQLITSNLQRQQCDSDRQSLADERKLIDAQIAALSVNAGPYNVSHDLLQQLKHRREIIDRLQHSKPAAGNEQEYSKFLSGAHIVCTTLSSCIKLLQYTNYFDVCIIDEATQCLEPWTLIPLEFGISSLVLVGDTQQLPATVLSPITKEYGFGVSLFTRMQKCLDGAKNNPIHVLKTQYRMHPDICHWPNSFFYNNMLISDASTSEAPCLVKPYSVLSLQYDQHEKEKGKILNVLEAKFVVNLVLNLVKLIPSKYFSYGIITPYMHQRNYLQKQIDDTGTKNIFVNTIDSYQGKEKDVIIISSVRTRGVGFLGNCQRLNVAMTRAKKCLILCGNFSSLEREPVWRSLLEDARQRKLFYNVKESHIEDFENTVMCLIKVKID